MIKRNLPLMITIALALAMVIDSFVVKQDRKSVV